MLKEKGKENKGHNQHTPESSLLSVNDKTHNTQKEIAKDLGWSTGKVAQAEQVWKKPDLKEKVKAGELTINGAYKEIKKEQKNQTPHNKEFVNIETPYLSFFTFS